MRWWVGALLIGGIAMTNGGLRGRLAALPEIAPWLRPVEQLGGRVVDPFSFPADLVGFAAFLDASGVEFFSAAEMTRPNHITAAQRAGFDRFLPPREWWTRGAALALLSDHLRRAAAGPARMRNWWRPRAYDLQPEVGGSGSGDHVTATAVDLDFADGPAAERALVRFKQLRTRHALNARVGLYRSSPRTLHVSIGSPRGRADYLV